MITLREDQERSILAIRHALLQHQSVVYRGPSGSGKTVKSSYMALGAQKKNKRVIFGVHRKELIRQTANTFDRFGIKYGYIASGYDLDPFATVHIASADTLRSRHNLLECDLFIPDEMHLWASETRLAMIDEVKRRGAKVVGLSATPQRGNGQGLGSLVSSIVEGPTEAWLIEHEFLARYKAYAPTSLDMTGVKKQSGDWAASSLDDKFNKPQIYGDKINSYRQFAYGKRLLGYCHSRENGRETEAAFIEAGIPAKFIDGETPDNDRRNAIVDFADGKHILLNCNLAKEGWDLSAQIGRNVPIQAVGLWTPTESLPMALQMMMRPLRPQDEPAVILDQAGIFSRHGFPEDEREWSLEGYSGKKSGGDADVTLSKCPKCHYAQRMPFTCCPECGSVREVVSRKLPQVQDAIEEIDVEAARQLKQRAFIEEKVQERACKSLEDWQRLARERGHKMGWAFHRYRIAMSKRKRA